MASVADPTLLENSERGHYKRGIATTILKMVYEFQALPKCSSTAEALSALTWGIQSDWRDTDLLQVMWDGFAQVHFFGNAQFDWQICFGALIKAIDAYRRGDLRNVGHRTDWACGIINKGGTAPPTAADIAAAYVATHPAPASMTGQQWLALILQILTVILPIILGATGG